MCPRFLPIFKPGILRWCVLVELLGSSFFWLVLQSQHTDPDKRSLPQFPEFGCVCPLWDKSVYMRLGSCVKDRSTVVYVAFPGARKAEHFHDSVRNWPRIKG